MQVGGRHYKTLPIEPWDYIAANKLGFFEGNIVKYITRAAKTGHRDDLLKAQHYLSKLLEITPIPEEQVKAIRSARVKEHEDNLTLPQPIKTTDEGGDIEPQRRRTAVAYDRQQPGRLLITARKVQKITPPSGTVKRC